MNVVDSSGWLEYLADGPNADFFANAIEDSANLIVPTVCLFEVFKRICIQRNEQDALSAVASMRLGSTVDLTDSIALAAAKLSAALQLPMADSIIYYTAKSFSATLWTQDADFEGLEGVRYRKKS